jgi:murein DD-endopeptidase MepM/ murein hydrolase activator NlpD
MWPVKGRLTSNMGFRIDPFTKRRAYHAGIDIANRIGTKVTAAQYGKVIFSGYRGNYGKTVIIRHPDGYKTLYAHLYKINVKRGQAVKQGEVIGSIGSSGRSTGPHLHFEVHQNGKVLDPRKVLSSK